MKLKLFFLLLLVGFLPALPAASVPPVGFVDVLNKDSISGWAKDPDNSNVPISVHVYCYPRHSRKALWGISLKADKYRSDLGAHGFVLSDSRYKDLPDGEYEIIVYAIGRDKTGSVDNQNVALKLSQVGREVNPTRQLIKKDTFAIFRIDPDEFFMATLVISFMTQMMKAARCRDAGLSRKVVC
jgi:hypothetical protein